MEVVQINKNNNEFPSGPFQFSLAVAGRRPKLSRPRMRTVASGSASITESMISNAAAAPPAPPPPVKAATKPTSDVIAGALARAAAQSTIHPLDTLKVRLQTSKGVSMPGVSKFGRLVPPAGGLPEPIALVATFGQSVASLYKGVLGAATGAGIAIGAYFAFYGAASNTISRNTDWSAGMVAFVSGGIAAAGSSVVKVPLAVCIRSVQAGVYPNVFKAASSIVGAAGPRGLFTGYFPTLLEDVPDMAFKFACYESMRNLHTRLNHRAPSPQEDFTMGAIAGAAAAAATTPLDVIKTNMMCTAASRPSMASAARAVMAQGGYNAFFRGVGARALSNGINSAVFFAFFESLRGVMAARAAAKKRAAAAAVAAEEFDFKVKPLVIDVDFDGEENLTADRAVATV